MLCVSSFPVVAAAAVVVLSILSCRQDVAACVVLTVVLSKTAVPSQHLRRVVVVAASVLSVWKAMAVVWSPAAVVPGEASVRSSTAAGHSQETSVGAAVVVLVYYTDLGGKLSTSALLWKRLSVLLCQSLWYIVVAVGLLLGSTLWYSCRFRSNVKVPSSVTSLSCRSLARLPSSRDCVSKGVKPERFRLTASEKSPRTYIGDCRSKLSAVAQYVFSLLEGLELHKNGRTNSLCSVYLHRLTHLYVPTNYLSYFGFTQIPCFPENMRYPKEEEVVPSRLSVQEFNFCFKIVVFFCMCSNGSVIFANS